MINVYLAPQQVEWNMPQQLFTSSRLAAKVAEKRDVPYAVTLNWI